MQGTRNNYYSFQAYEYNIEDERGPLKMVIIIMAYLNLVVNTF
jgi:hypothetical protein